MEERNWKYKITGNWTAVIAVAITTAVSGGFTEGELRMITGADEGYTLKFKTLEWMQKLKAFLFGG